MVSTLLQCYSIMLLVCAYGIYTITILQYYAIMPMQQYMASEEEDVITARYNQINQCFAEKQAVDSVFLVSVNK